MGHLSKAESDKPKDKIVTSIDLLDYLDVHRGLGLSRSAIADLAVMFLTRRYGELVKQAGGELKAEMLVVKRTGLQPSAYAAKSIIERVPYLEKALQTTNQPTGAVLDTENGILVVDGSTIALEQSEKFLLNVLVAKGAAKLGDLETACTRPDKVLKALLKKHPALKGYVTLPGGPGRGGYSTTIKQKKRPAGSCQK
jgi:hypothetical protein